MRLNYYEFPEVIDAHTRFLNGSVNNDGECTKGYDSCRNCQYNNGGGGFRECEHYVCNDSETTLGGISVTEAKRLLKEYGGIAYTYHCDRDGSVFETTEIRLKGNNSQFQYNRHL